MSDRPLRQFLRARLTPWDVGIHSGVALVLVLTYLAPVPFDTFLFRPGVSDWPATYLSLFGHANPIHLVGNVLGYLILSLLSLLLLANTTRRRFYYASVIVLFALVPPLSSLVMELLLQQIAPEAIGQYRGAGFSLLTAAFLGLLSISIAVHQSEVLSSPLPAPVSSCGLFVLVLAIPAIRYEWPALLGIVFGFVGLLFLGHAALLVRSKARSGATVLEAALSFVATVTFVGAASDLFPSRPEIVGVEPHLVGFVCGFALVWLALVISIVSRQGAGQNGIEIPK